MENFEKRMPTFLRVVMLVLILIILAHCKSVFAGEIDEIEEDLGYDEYFGEEGEEEQDILDEDISMDVFEIPVGDAVPDSQELEKLDSNDVDQKEDQEEELFYTDNTQGGAFVYQKDSSGDENSVTIVEENPGNDSANEASVTAEESLVQLVTIIPFCTGIISGILIFRYFLF